MCTDRSGSLSLLNKFHLCMYECLCTCMLCVCVPLEAGEGCQELELQGSVGCWMWGWKQNWGPLAEPRLLSPLSPFSGPSVVSFTRWWCEPGRAGPENGVDKRKVSRWSQLYSAHQTVCTLEVKKDHPSRVLLSSSCLWPFTKTNYTRQKHVFP